MSGNKMSGNKRCRNKRCRNKRGITSDALHTSIYYHAAESWDVDYHYISVYQINQIVSNKMIHSEFIYRYNTGKIYRYNTGKIQVQYR